MKTNKTREFTIPGIYFDVARIDDSDRLVCGSSDTGVYEVDLTSEKPQPVRFFGPGHRSYVTAVAQHDNTVITGSYDRRLIWWDLLERRQIRAIDAHQKWIRQVAVSPNGALVASVADDMLVRLWDRETGELFQTLEDHQPQTPHHYPSMLYAVAFSSDGRLLASGDKTGHIAIWDMAGGTKIGEVESPAMYTWDPRARRHSIGGVRSLAFSHDNFVLAVGGIGKIGNIDHLGGPSRVELFDWRSGRSLRVMEDNKFKGLVEQIQFGPGDAWLVCAGGDHAGFVTVYSTANGSVLHQEKAPMHVHGFAVTRDIDAFAAVGHGKIAAYTLSPA